MIVLEWILEILLSLIVLFVGLYAWDAFKKNIIINFIVNDINETFGGNYSPDFIKKKVYLKYGAFRKLYRNTPCLWEDRLHNRVENELEYVYCIISSLCAEDNRFSYDLFRHCTRRFAKKGTEYGFLLYCIKTLVDKSNSFSFDSYSFNKCLGLLCKNMFDIHNELDNKKTSINLTKILTLVEAVRKECLEESPSYLQEEIEQMCNLYVAEIEVHWKELISG